MTSRRLPENCPLCEVRHTEIQQRKCYQELQSRLEKREKGERVKPEDARAFNRMSDLMNKYNL